MQRYKILHENFDNVVVKNFDPTPFVYAKDLTTYVEGKWLSEEVKAKAEGRSLFDGALVRINSMKLNGRTLELDLQRTSFKYFWATNTAPQEITGFDPQAENPLMDRMANPIGVGVISITTDNKIVVGEKSAKTVDGRGRLSIAPAGYTNPDTDFGSLRGETDDVFGTPGYASGNSPLNTCLKELSEELGVGPSRPIALVLDRLWARHPLLITTIRLPYTFDEILRNYKNTKQEYKEVHFIPNTPSSINNYVEANHDRLYPHSEGALTIWSQKFSEFNHR